MAAPKDTLQTGLVEGFRARVLLMQRRLSSELPIGVAKHPDDAYLLAHFVWPASVLVGLVIFGLACVPFRGAYWLLMGSEQGVIENGTVVAALVGTAVAFQLVRGRSALPNPWVLVWFWFFVVGTFFLAGEEASWGQQWFHWSTPAYWAARNEQGETNLHNIARWSENDPKLVLMTATMLTGVVWPICAWFRVRLRALWSTPLRLIWPSAVIWPSAAITLVVRLGERAWSNVPGIHTMNPLEKSLKEGVELFLAIFVVAYLCDMRKRYLGSAGHARFPFRSRYS